MDKRQAVKFPSRIDMARFQLGCVFTEHIHRKPFTGAGVMYTYKIEDIVRKQVLETSATSQEKY